MQASANITGNLFRESSLEMVLALTIIHGNIPSPFTVEAMACFQAVKTGPQMGLSKVIP